MSRPLTIRMYLAVWMLALCGLCLPSAFATELSGQLTDPQGRGVPDATVRILRRADAVVRETRTGSTGLFTFKDLAPGEYRVTAVFPGLAVFNRTLTIHPDGIQNENFQFAGLAAQAESVNVTASVADRGVFEPDPAEQVMIRDQTLDANPGRPGMPVSIPGIDRPRYF